jgi:hypothetical protein
MNYRPASQAFSLVFDKYFEWRHIVSGEPAVVGDK